MGQEFNAFECFLRGKDFFDIKVEALCIFFSGVSGFTSIDTNYFNLDAAVRF